MYIAHGSAICVTPFRIVQLPRPTPAHRPTPPAHATRKHRAASAQSRLLHIGGFQEFGMPREFAAPTHNTNAGVGPFDDIGSGPTETARISHPRRLRCVSGIEFGKKAVGASGGVKMRLRMIQIIHRSSAEPDWPKNAQLQRERTPCTAPRCRRLARGHVFFICNGWGRCGAAHALYAAMHSHDGGIRETRR